MFDEYRLAVALRLIELEVRFAILEECGRRHLGDPRHRSVRSIQIPNVQRVTDCRRDFQALRQTAWTILEIAAQHQGIAPCVGLSFLTDDYEQRANRQIEDPAVFPFPAAHAFLPVPTEDRR